MWMLPCLSPMENWNPFGLESFWHTDVLRALPSLYYIHSHLNHCINPSQDPLIPNAHSSLYALPAPNTKHPVAPPNSESQLTFLLFSSPFCCTRASKCNILLFHHKDRLSEIDTPIIAPTLKIRKLRSRLWFALTQSIIDAKTRTQIQDS